MFFSPQLTNQDRLTFSKYWGWFLTLGIVLLCLGMLAIGLSTLTTLITVIILGMIIFAAGVIIIVDTFKFWWRKWGGFFLHLAMGILYLLVGIMLFANPLAASISLTLLLGIFYIVIGVFRIIYSLSLKSPRWGWSFFNGLISLLLGMLITANWPMSSLFIIGLFVGIDLFFCGWTYIMLALFAQNMTRDKA